VILAAGGGGTYVKNSVSAGATPAKFKEGAEQLAPLISRRNNGGASPPPQQKAIPVIGFLGSTSPGAVAAFRGRVPPATERNRLC